MKYDDVVYNIDLSDSKGDKNFTAFELCCDNSYSGWNAEHVGDSIIFQGRQVGEKTGVFSYTSDGSSVATWTTIQTGASMVTEFTKQTDWDGDSEMKTIIDPHKNNLYEIEYAWFGSSNIEFRIYNPMCGMFETVHTLKFANTADEPSLNQPNMFIQEGIASLGSTVAMKMTSTCSAGFTSGNYKIPIPVHSVDVSKAIYRKVETVLLCIKPRDTINGFSNQSQMYIKRFTVAVDGSKPVKIRFVKNPTTMSSGTIDDYCDYRFINESNSLGIVDKNSNTYTGGDIIDSFFLQKQESYTIDFTSNMIELFQGEVLAITAESYNSSNVDISVSILDDI